MTNKISGLIIFGLGAIYMIVIGAMGGKYGASPAFHLQYEELQQTVWRLGSPLMMFWSLSGWVGPILASVGLLIYVRAKGTYIWLSGTGLFLILLIDQILLPSEYYRPVYGIGGSLIAILFLAILWMWAKKYQALEVPERISSYFQLISYVFFFMSAWVICGRTGELYYESMKDVPHKSPASLMGYIALAWFFLFLSHYKSVRVKRTAGGLL